ncbi:hypothetical protein BREVUG8_110455 [Brevundimonas sp. G8]|nr:hypothetical protein BREVUG8_110455 [Brevundimonas sp. G8]
MQPKTPNDAARAIVNDNLKVPSVWLTVFRMHTPKSIT